MTLEQEKQSRYALATDQQRRAADPDVSVWVEASAGTGKTKVLSDRVLRLLLKGVLPGRILCLTYTKAAAVNMSSRIADKLAEWAVAEDEKLYKELEKLLGAAELNRNKPAELTAQARKLFAILLDTPGGMKIQTIHSFCQEVLKRFPLEAKISPYFEVMDDRTAAEAMDDIKRRLLLKLETEPESRAAQALAYVTTQVSEFTFPKLMNSLTQNRNKILQVLEQSSSVEALVDKIAGRLGIDDAETEETARAAFFAAAEQNRLQALAEAMQSGSETDREKAQALAAVYEAKDYAAYRDFFLTGKNEVRKSFATKAVIQKYPDGDVWARGEALRCLEFDNKLAALRVFASTRAVLYLADELLQGYQEYKRLHSKTDYEDLIVNTRRLLENPQVADWVLYKLDGGIDNVLIDEAQDTSPDQWAIVRAITNEFFYGSGAKDKNCTVFVVGDRKQSIYSFQGADPHEFERMRQYFLAKKNEGIDFREVNLDVSFRSTAAILDTVNRIFAEALPRQGVAAEDRQVAHVPSRIGEAGRVEIWPLIEAEPGEKPDAWMTSVERKMPETAEARLARQIAETIRHKVQGGELLKAKGRPLQYRDFMILVQKRNLLIGEIVRACKKAGVAIAGVDKIKLGEQIAVQDLISLGKFMLLPTDDLSLAEVLKSPLFGLNDDDLFALCYRRGSRSLFASLDADEKYRPLYRLLQSWLNLVDFMRPFEFYSHVLNTYGGRKKFVARLGFEAEDGLDEFLNLCLDFEQTHVPVMQLFIDWMEKDDVEIKRELEQSDADAVRIMTVHGSKGLQAPYVIMPDTSAMKSINEEMGLLADGDVLYYPLCSADYEDNCRRYKEKERQARKEEYHRLLYVALTRAEECLCLCGYKGLRGGNDQETWYEMCKNSFAKMAVEDQNGILSYELAQEIDVKKEDKTDTKTVEAEIPAWLEQDAPQEGRLARPLAPSRLTDDEEDEVALSPLDEGPTLNTYRRGALMHKLLQYLPETKPECRGEMIAAFLDGNAAEMPDRQKEKIRDELLSLLENEEFAAVFGPQSKAEVPLMGMVEGKIVAGQIDRLVVTDDTVMIIDFKTNRPAARCQEDVPAAYVSQLNAYAALIAEIYPQKTIGKYILWTNTAFLMKLD